MSTWNPEAWLQFIGDEQRLIMGLAALLLLLLAWLGARFRKRQRVFAMLRAVNDTTYGRSVPRSHVGAWGFAVAIQPPPEPFREFNVSYRAVSILDPIDLVRRLLGRYPNRLQIGGSLLLPPAQEILWVRGQPPTRALGRQPGRAMWVQHKFEFTGTEYATRGSNINGLRHAFTDIYTRYNPLLQWVSVQKERTPEIRIMVEGAIDVRDVSPLITSARAIGRAALLE